MLISLFMWCNCNILHSQLRLERWETHTSLLNVRMADIDNNGVIWAVATGGIFSYDERTQEFQIFRNIDALLNLDMTAIRVDRRTNDIYAGSFDGTVEIYRNNHWTHVTGIFDESFPRAAINDFAFRDTLVFIAGDFGLTVFNAVEEVFIEDPALFKGVPVHRLHVSQGRLWAAADTGLHSVDINRDCFTDPGAWTNHLFDGGRAPAPVVSVAEVNGTIYAASGMQIWRLQGEGLTATMDSDKEITGLIGDDTELYFTTGFTVGSLSGSFDRVLPERLNGIGLFPSPENNTLRLFGYFSASGLGTLQTESLQFTVPNSPRDNRFADLAVAPDGTVWGVSGNSGDGAGIYSYNGSEWLNFHTGDFPDIGNNKYISISTDQDGNIWAGNTGDGLLQLRADNGPYAPVNRFDTENSSIVGFSPGSSFAVVGAVRTDPSGVTWITNLGNSELPIRTRDGQFQSMGSFSRSPKDYLLLEIDFSGTKWFGTDQGGGLLWFNERFTPDDPSDDLSDVVTSSNSSITENSQTALAVDKTGALWIGTSKGLFTITNPNAVLTGNRLFSRAITDMNNRIVNDIVVDALNLKWVATNTGVWVLNEDGTEILDQIEMANSPLLSDKVVSIATDESNGRMYFGTEAGLSSVLTLSVRSNASFDQLECYPQPFIPTRDAEMVIEGLAENSIVKVVTVDGILVRNLDALNSRKSVWDGRDENGEIVPSGVYIISAFSESLSEQSAVKALVIRRQ